MERCPACGAKKLKMVAEPHTLHIGGARADGTVRACLCAGCGESFTRAEEQTELELQAAAAILASGWFDRDVLRFGRRALGLSGVALAGLLGVEAETVSRWENGKRDAPRPIYLTLAGLIADRLARRPSAMAGAASARRPRKAPHVKISGAA